MEYIFDFEIKNKKSNKLECIITKARKIIETMNNCDIKESGLINKCDTACSILAELLDENNIDYSWIETNNVLGNDVLGHAFLVVNFNNNKYIVDLTYLQFFSKDTCQAKWFKEKDGVTILAPDPGYYYTVNLDKKNIAIQLLENGYIKLNEESAKAYLDSFYFTRRGRRVEVEIDKSICLNALNKDYGKSRK